MGIDVELKSESGEILMDFGDLDGVLAKATRNTFSGTRLLKYLVPWGDAIFNQAQANDLASDIQDIRTNYRGDAIAEHLRQIEPLIENLAAGTHLYLWFIGD